MASAVYQTKLTADTTQHDQALGRSAKQVYNYKKSCDSTDKSVSKLLGGFKKFAGVLGVVKIAGDTFHKMMDNNQEMADRFGSAMEVANTITGEFAHSLSTFDFSNMYDGLGDLIERAKAYYDALDNLQTFNLAFVGIDAHDQAALAEAFRLIKEGKYVEGLAKLDEAEKSAGKTAEAHFNKAAEALAAYVGKIAYAKESVRKSGSLLGWVKGDQKWIGEAELSVDKVRSLIYDAAKGGHALRDEIAGAERALAKAEAEASEYNEAHLKWHAVAKAKAYLQVLKNVKDELTDGENLKQFSLLDAEMMNAKRTYDDLQRTIIRYRNMAQKGIDGENDSKKPKVKAKVELEPPPPGSIAEMEQVIAKLKDDYRKATTDEGEMGRNHLKEMIIAAEKELEVMKGELDNLPEGSVAKIQKELQQLKLEWSLAPTDEKRAEVQQRIDEVQAELDRINGKVEIPVQPKTPKQALQELINDLRYQLAMADTPELQMKIGFQIDDLVNQMEKLDESLMTPQERIQARIDELKKGFEELGNWCSDACDLMSQAMLAFANSNDEAANKTLKSAASIISAIGSAIPKILALVSAEQADAIAGAVASGAKLPFPYNIGAIASVVAQVLSALAPIATLIAQANSFATGGIFNGSGPKYGDMHIARVNPGEMILNNRQQANLFRLLNGNVGPQTGGNNGGHVEFHISGTDLVGVLNNNERKNNRVR